MQELVSSYLMEASLYIGKQIIMNLEMLSPTEQIAYISSVPTSHYLSIE